MEPLTHHIDVDMRSRPDSKRQDGIGESGDVDLRRPMMAPPPLPPIMNQRHPDDSYEDPRGDSHYEDRRGPPPIQRHGYDQYGPRGPPRGPPMRGPPRFERPYPGDRFRGPGRPPFDFRGPRGYPNRPPHGYGGPNYNQGNMPPPQMEPKPRFNHLPTHIDPAALFLVAGASTSNNEEIVIDRRTFEIAMDGPPRKIMIDDTYQTIRVRRDTRQVLLDELPVYVIGEPIKDVMFSMQRHKLYYRGPERHVWIDGCQFDIRVDGPPQCLAIQGKQHEIRVNSLDNEIIIDGIGQGKFGGPPRIMTIGFDKHEIRFDAPSRDIIIDNKLCQLRLDYPVPVVVMRGKPHGICFDGPPREIIIDDMTYLVNMDQEQLIKIGKRAHRVAFLGPGREVIIDGQTFEIQFNMQPREISLHGRLHMLSLRGSPPEVKILDEIPRDEMGRLMFLPPKFLEHAHREMIARTRHPIPMPPLYYPPIEAVAPTPATVPSQAPPVTEAPTSQPGPVPTSQQLAMPFNVIGAPMMAMGGVPGMPFQTMAVFQMPVNMAGAGGLVNMMPNMQFMNPSMQGAQQPQIPISTAQPTQPTPTTTTGQSNTEINVFSLLDKLKAFGMLQDKKDKAKEEEEREKEIHQHDGITIAQSESLTIVEKIPDLSKFDTDLLKKKHGGVLQRLYLGIQCSSCGERFVHEECERYKQHLDWHFRQNKKEKEEMKIAKFRKWFYDTADWVNFEEIVAEEEQSRKNFFARSMQVHQDIGIAGFQDMLSTPLRVPEQYISCPAASGNENDDVCDICGDPFEQFWDEESEAWHLKDAVRVDTKTYHPVCYEDAKETSMLETPPISGQSNSDTSPSPLANVALPPKFELPMNSPPGTPPPKTPPSVRPVPSIKQEPEDEKPVISSLPPVSTSPDTVVTSTPETKPEIRLATSLPTKLPFPFPSQASLNIQMKSEEREGARSPGTPTMEESPCGLVIDESLTPTKDSSQEDMHVPLPAPDKDDEKDTRPQENANQICVLLGGRVRPTKDMLEDGEILSD